MMRVCNIFHFTAHGVYSQGGGTVRCRSVGGLPGLLHFLFAVERRPWSPSEARSMLAIPYDRG